MNLKFSRVVQFIGALLLAFGLAGAAQAQISDINSAINKAGRERMLSQRMAKAYFFRQLNVNAGPAAEMLDQATKEFAKAQAELRGAATNSPQINTELGLVDQQWFFFQNALVLKEGVDPKRAAADVATTSERILEQMDLVVGLYEKLAAR